jgi:hypothetical protein
MPKEESEFQKLLSEAPLAPSSDTLTVVGALSRSADPTHFVLTLLNGQSETLEVAVVKSARKIAGAIGQPLVELELDAKRVPEKILDWVKKPPYNEGIGLTTDFIFGVGDPQAPQAPNTGYLDITQTYGEHIPPPTTPFTAAMPHQAGHPALYRKPPQKDLHVPPKDPVQDGTGPLNSVDITGFGGFDVITWQNAQPVYYY